MNPNRRIGMNDSRFVIGAEVLPYLEKPQTVYSLWNNVKHIPTIASFEEFTATLDILLEIGKIDSRKNILWRT